MSIALLRLSNIIKSSRFVIRGDRAFVSNRFAEAFRYGSIAAAISVD